MYERLKVSDVFHFFFIKPFLFPCYSLKNSLDDVKVILDALILFFKFKFYLNAAGFISTEAETSK